jgi:integrase
MSHGSGSILRFGKKWRASINIAGERLRKVLKTNDDAKAWLADRRREKAARELGPGASSNRKLTYGDLVPDLLDWYADGSRRVYSDKTREGYKTELRKIEAYWGPRLVVETRTPDVDAWVRQLRKDKLSTSTIRHSLDRLSALHQLAVRRGYLDRVPCSIERPRLVQLSLRKPLEDADVTKLIAAARAHHDRRVLAIVLLATDAGLRRSEMLNLRGVDVDLESGFLHVGVRGEKRDRTKAGRPREVPILTERLRAALEAFPRGDTPLLELRSSHGVHGMASRAWERAFGKGKAAQLHRLRHGFATRLADAGFEASKIMVWMGHTSLSTTQRYLHPDARTVSQTSAKTFRALSEGAIPGPRRGPSRPAKPGKSVGTA